MADDKDVAVSLRPGAHQMPPAAQPDPRAASRPSVPERGNAVGAGAALEQHYEIILKPVSHPALGDIGIDENLFAVGRTEPPFDAYPPDVVADLSRRHARIFCEKGVVHIADMGSKNGTAVNGIDVRQRTARLQDGDELRFGRSLSFRVQLQAKVPPPVARLVSLTLRPLDDSKGLQPIVVTQFPFLISKADATFARYRPDHPHQVNYLSRRHAHVFLKRGMPFVEDLGSTNGTFVNGRRLDEHAVALEDNDTLGFGGHFFVYQVSRQQEEQVADPTLTQYVGTAVPGDADADSSDGTTHAANPATTATTATTTTATAAAAMQAAHQGAIPAPRELRIDIERTTFIGAPDSFLDIFCVDQAPAETSEARPDAAQGAAGADQGGSAPAATPSAAATATTRRQGPLRMVASQLVRNLTARDRRRLRRGAWLGAGVGAVLLALSLTLYFGGAREREIRQLMQQGDHVHAVAAANLYLQRRPDNAEVRALATEALLKAYLPQWMDAIKAGDFKRADGVVAAMRMAGSGVADSRSFLRELTWIGALERFVASGTAADRPIRIYADEQRISALMAQWDDDPLGHQRAAASMTAQVAAFGDTYATALSQLRRLQSDTAAYLTAIERLKSAIATELQNDRPEAIAPLLKTYAEKYPRLTGIEPLDQDLQRYLVLHRALRSGRLGTLVAQQEQARFSTPAFQIQFAALAANGRLPPAEIFQQYQAIRTSWRRGETAKAMTALSSLSTGSWAAAAGAELAHKQQVQARATALQQNRGAAEHAERLVAFYEMLEPEEDAYFINAAQADPAFDRPRVMRRVQDHLNRASALWQQYRQAGPIDDAMRLEDTVSDAFRSSARILAQARQEAELMLRLQRVSNAQTLQPARHLAEEIAAETGLQRNALLGARTSLSPDVLKTKLDLLELPALPPQVPLAGGDVRVEQGAGAAARRAAGNGKGSGNGNGNDPQAPSRKSPPAPSRDARSADA